MYSRLKQTQLQSDAPNQSAQLAVCGCVVCTSKTTQAAKQAWLACTVKATPSEGETRKSVELPWTLKLYLTAGSRVSVSMRQVKRVQSTLDDHPLHVWQGMDVHACQAWGG